MILTGKDGSIPRKTWPGATSSTINPTWNGLGFRSDLRQAGRQAGRRSLGK